MECLNIDERTLTQNEVQFHDDIISESFPEKSRTREQKPIEGVVKIPAR